MNDTIRLAMEQAADNFMAVEGPRDGVFNAAGFAQAIARIAGVSPGPDGRLVRAMLSGRDDVEPLSGGAHYRLLEVAP